MDFLQAQNIVDTPTQDRMSLVIDILKIYNLRISEILSLKWTDIKGSRLIYVEAKKRSRDTVIRDRQIVQSILSLHKIDNTYIFYPLNYHKVYNYIKRNLSHLFSKKYNTKNSKVTHYFRFENANLVHDVSKVSVLLNHKSHKSAHYYNHNLKEVNND
jgi:integrase